MSQSQLLQPFVGILAAVRLLGELLDAITPGFALLVVASVFMKRRTTKHTRPQ
jgi:drug/metabolite transporter (DMT)-like permease